MLHQLQSRSAETSIAGVFAQLLMNSLAHICFALSNALIVDKPDLPTLLAQATRCLGHEPAWLNDLCEIALNDGMTIAQLKQYQPLVDAYYSGQLNQPIAHYFLPLSKMHEPHFNITQKLPLLNRHYLK